MIIKKTICVLAVAAILAGCQAPTESEWAEFCANDKWLEHGYFDATKGISMDIARGYKVRCGDEFSSAELADYQRGYLKGAIEFCTEDNGYKYGNGNRPNPESCPAELRAKFMEGYRTGLAEYHRVHGILAQEKREREQERAQREHDENMMGTVGGNNGSLR